MKAVAKVIVTLVGLVAMYTLIGVAISRGMKIDDMFTNKWRGTGKPIHDDNFAVIGFQEDGNGWKHKLQDFKKNLKLKKKPKQTIIAKAPDHIEGLAPEPA